MYFRTATAVEVGLVLERGSTVDTIVEIKRTTAPVASAGLHVAIATLEPKNAYVVHGGDETWLMHGGITAISVKSLMDHL